ncbi:MAG: OmpA family protein [Proteobacteria bacterium]|nr:OmpA family protein [Pseudomonadota bacterium]
MRKKIVELFIMTLFMSLPAFAVEFSPDAGIFVPSAFAIAKDSEIILQSIPTAYRPLTFNAILEAYGLKLPPEAVKDVPPSYAKVADGKIAFGKVPTAYSPVKMHSIFTAYGLQISPESVSTKLGSASYASVKDGKIVFGKTPTAYSGKELAGILAAYELPRVEPPAPVAVPEPAPVKEVVVPPPPVVVDSDGDGVPDKIDACPGTPKGVEVDERGCWILKPDFFFNLNSAKINPQVYPVLDGLEKVFNQNPTMKLQIEGHADNTGTAQYNQQLSEKRAKAIITYLVDKLDISPDRLSAVGFGEEKPIASNDTKEGRAKNRRVELTPIW